jgi:methyl-accepting chemotaxis protein
MKSLARRLASISLLWQTLVPVLLCVAIGIAAVQIHTVQHTRSLLQDRLAASLNANLAMLQADVERLGSDPRRNGDNLLVGDTVLNGRNELVDRVAGAAGGVATIFAGDTRVATTLRTDDGKRAVGTILALGPARTAALDHGETYHGTATILGNNYVTIYQPLKAATGATVGLLFVGVPTAPTEAALAASEQQALYTSVTVLGVIGLVIGFMMQRILAPLTAMTRAMNQIAIGDLDTAIPALERKDQVGRMAAALGVFKQQAVENIRFAREQDMEQGRAAADKRATLLAMAETVEREATSAMAEVDQRTAAMEQTANGMSASAERAGASAQSSAEAAAQTLANAQTVSTAAEELSVSIREIGEQVGRSSAVVERAVQAGHAARETIGALNEQVTHIGAVADMIGEIAAKTNLLALNATIEAARAGQAGKSFAVVASEVKQLATLTARSTEEISRRIGEVRTATGASVAAVGHIEQTIDEINAIAGSIAAAVEQQGVATAVIARNVTETAEAANTMTERAVAVSKEAATTGQQAAEVLQNTSALDMAIHALRHTMIRVVRTATSEVDRRQYRRRPCLVESTVSYEGKPEPATLHDISEHGCYAVTKLRCPAGHNAEVLLTRSGKRLACVVEAQVENGLHLMFSGENLTAQEADRMSLTTIADLVNLTKADHVAFVRRVAEAVEGREALSPDSLPKSHLCRLGRWYDSVNDPSVLALPSFQAIHAPHEDVHRSGQQALVALAAQHMPAAQRHVAELMQHSEHVLRCLDDFGRAYPATIDTSRAAA